jgi:hypothetical protein
MAVVVVGKSGYFFAVDGKLCNDGGGGGSCDGRGGSGVVVVMVVAVTAV